MARKKKEEQPEAKTAKKEDAIEWRTDTPEKPGLYDCMENGERKTLQYKRCIFTKRSYWMHIDGTDVAPNAEVKWHEGKVFSE